MLPNDIIELIAERCPPSVNVCLASRTMRAGRAPRTRACADYSHPGLWEEARRPELSPSQQRRCRRWVVHAAARAGDTAFLDTVVRDEEFNVSDVAHTAARYGSLDTLVWAHRAGYRCSRADVCAAARSGSRDLVRWILEHNPSVAWDPTVTLHACENEDMEMLEWAVARGCPVHPDAGVAACVRKNGAMIEFLGEHGGELRPAGCNILIQAGDLGTLRRWVAAGGKWHEDSTVVCAVFGRIEMLRWAVENGCPWADKTCVYLINTGDIGLLQWACAHGCHVPFFAAAYAENRGHHDMASWIQQYQASDDSRE